MHRKPFFRRNDVRIFGTVFLVCLYLVTALKFIETMPMTCTISYPIEVLLHCPLANAMMWVSILLLVLTGLYLTIATVFRLNNT